MTTTSLPIFFKRINKELENFNDKKYISGLSDRLKILFNKITIDIITESKSNSNIDNYFLKILKNNNFYLELSIPSCYPFKPYDIVDFKFKYSLNYFRHLNNLYEKIKFKDKKILLFFFENQYQMQSKFLCLHEKSCYCCHSITCPNNWSPSCRIDHVLLEYLEIEFIQNYTSNLGYKYLLNIYNNLFKNKYFSQLPDEIIKIILNKTITI